MKRLNGLFERIISLTNLRLAAKKARQGKSYYAIKKFDRNADYHIRRLHDGLKNGTFHTSPYTIFKVYEPKQRMCRAVAKIGGTATKQDIAGWYGWLVHSDSRHLAKKILNND